MRYFLFLLFAACSSFQRIKTEIPLTSSDKTYIFSTHDLNLLLRTFSSVLKKEGYDVTSQDLQTGKLTAWIENKDQMAKLNSEFSVGSNYVVSETLSLNLQLKNTDQGIEAALNIKNTEKYSMGEDSVKDLNDRAAYQDIFSKVKLAL